MTLTLLMLIATLGKYNQCVSLAYTIYIIKTVLAGDKPFTMVFGYGPDQECQFHI